MRAVDTNIVLRAILGDHAKQTPIAVRIMAGETFIPITVLIEIGWMLSRSLRYPRPQVADTLSDLVDSSTVADEPHVRWAIARYRAGADFAAMLHLVTARDMAGFVTFDRELAQDAGPDAPVAVAVV